MDIQKRRTLRAIQLLATIPGDGHYDERLATIADLATGKLDPDSLKKRQNKDELLRRLNIARGIVATEATEARKHRGGKDRKHRGGQDRAEL